MGAEENGAQQQNNAAGAANETGNQNQQQSNESGEKTFTQAEVGAIGAKEKAQGKSAILKLFGVASEEEAKTQAEEFKKWQESQKTEQQKIDETIKAATKLASQSEKRAIAAENKLTALAAGVTTESLEDALAIALRKTTDEKPLEKVLEEMKKESRYSGFFGTPQAAGGTGSSADHNKGQQKQENLGERLAKQRVAGVPTKSNFFKN